MESTTSNALTSREKSRHMIRLLEERGQDDYIGEDISQLEHCLQAADQAKRAGSQDEVRLISVSSCPDYLSLPWTLPSTHD